MSLLEVRDLRAGYGIVEVLFGLDFDVDAGEVVVVLGANGSGKTTTLRAVSGMIEARGSLRLDGQDIVGKSPDQLVKLGMAHVPQGRGTLTDLTVEENLRIGAFTRKDREVGQDIARWLEVFPRLGERRDQAAGSMSGGEQQMLAIARALMPRPRVLLLDEPTLGLAPIIVRQIAELVGQLRSQGLAILLAEQNAEMALKVSDRGYVLESGQMVMTGASRDLLNDPAIQSAYMGL